MTTRFLYDNAGNLLVDDKTRYSYDAFNRTTKVDTFDGNVQLNRYDAEGLRYEMEENGNLVQFIFNQEREVVTEEDSTGLTRLIRATELIARSTDAVRTYYHYASDEMGSTTHIVDDEGQVQNRYEYDAWGNPTLCEEKISNRFKFTGQQFDPITQQYYLRARFYNSVIARFTQEDTYRGDELNLYAYCWNNPTFYIDPTGNFTAKCMKDAYKRAIDDGKTKAEAYAIAKQVYWAGKTQTNGVEVKVEPGQSMTKEEWKARYRQERINLANARNDVDLELKHISSVLHAQEASRTTYGVAEVRLPNGDIELWVAGAGKRGYVRPVVRQSHFVARDKSFDASRLNRHNDAEQTLMRTAKNQGAEILAIGVTRPICGACREHITMNNLVQRAVSPFKDNIEDYLND